jgi:hypothetical protein
MPCRLLPYTNFHLNFDSALDSNLASWLGDARIDVRRSALLSALPSLIRPALRVLTQLSFVFMGTVTFATFLLRWRFLVTARMRNIRFGSWCSRTRIVCSLPR